MEKVYPQINLQPVLTIFLVQCRMIWSITISFAEKNSKKLIAHAATNDIYRNIHIIGNYAKIYNYVKANASKMELC